MDDLDALLDRAGPPPAARAARAPAKPAADPLDDLFARAEAPAPAVSRGTPRPSNLPLRGMQPAPKSDVDLGIESPAVGPQRVPELSPLRKAFPRATERSRAEDPVRNDPLAGAITAGIPAAAAATLVGGGAAAMGAGRVLSQVLGGGAGGAANAALSGEDPVTGAVIGGALPLAGPLIRGADNAVGRIAKFGVDHPAVITRPIQAAAGAAGAGLGASTAGPAGALAGGYMGKKAGDIVARRVSKSAAGIADRYAARNAPPVVEAPAPAAPAYDFPEPGQVRLSPAPRRARVKVADADILSSEPAAPPPAAETPSLRAQVIRDTRKFRSEPYYTEPSYRGYVSPEEASMARPRVLYPNDKGAELHTSGKVTAERWRGAGEAPPETASPAPGSDVGDKLAQTVSILGKLKAAKAAGSLTPALEQEAIDAGISPALVRRALGR